MLALNMSVSSECETEDANYEDNEAEIVIGMAKKVRLAKLDKD
jgi:hypothetical protein